MWHDTGWGEGRGGSRKKKRERGGWRVRERMWTIIGRHAYINAGGGVAVTVIKLRSVLFLSLPSSLSFSPSIGNSRASEKTTTFPSISVTTSSSTWVRTDGPPTAGSLWVQPGPGLASTLTLLEPAHGMLSSEATRGVWRCMS